MNQPPPRRPLSSQRRPVRPQRRSLDPRLLLGIGGGVVALIVLLALFIGPFSIFNPSDDGDETRFECPTVKNPPAPPDGLELAGPMKDFGGGKCGDRNVPAGAAAISMPLESGKSGRGLVFYTYTNDKWQRIGPAELSDDGKLARVVVDRIPANGVIMRRAPSAFQLMGVVPAGQALSADAEQVASVVGGADFVPAPDGAINGNITNIKRADAALLVPVVRATGVDAAQAVNAFVGNGEARAAHAANLARIVQANRLDGIELDYTQVDPARRADFTELVRQAADEVHKSGGILILTLPLPVKDGNNWNSGAYDWPALVKLADYLKIAPERDQSVYRKVVPDALTYLTGQVDPKKLMLTVSPLSAERSTEGIRLMSTLDALSIASQFTVRDRDRAAANADVIISADNLSDEGGAAGGINWDAITATVAFTYRSGDSPRTVWIENQFSAGFKAEYAQIWKLGGIAVDDASNNEGIANIWPALTPLLQDQPLLLQQPNPSLLKPEWQIDAKPYQVGRPVITWKAPADGGAHTIMLIVSDGVMRVASSTRLTLRPAAAGTPATPTPTGTTRPPTPTATPTR